MALAIIVVIAAGCGDSAPTAMEETPLLQGVDYITRAEFDGYIASVQSTIPHYNVMITEFTQISATYNAGFIPVYWTGAHARNLVIRVQSFLDHARRIRPQHPELLKLHVEEYEATFEDFLTGFTLFVQAVEQPGSVSINEVNDRIVDGNTHMIRLQILLSDLGNTPIDFFAPQGGGGGFPDEGFDGGGF